MKQRDLHQAFRLEYLFKLTGRLLNKDAVLKMALWVLGKQPGIRTDIPNCTFQMRTVPVHHHTVKTQQTIYSRSTSSFRSLSYDKSIVSSKATSPQIAI